VDHESAHITVDAVSKSYGSRRLRKEVLRDCSFTLERGKLTVVVGPSACGKTTLVRLLAGFEKPTLGSIKMEGRSVAGPGRDRLVVFQESALFPWISTRRAAEALLEKVGLSAFRQKYPVQLSGGMQRRAELARAMINTPSVMLLDDLFGVWTQ
jgi:sulfonate transport system ATP-binding protein